MTSLHPFYLSQALFPKAAVVGVRASICKFRGSTVQPTSVRHAVGPDPAVTEGFRAEDTHLVTPPWAAPASLGEKRPTCDMKGAETLRGCCTSSGG